MKHKLLLITYLLGIFCYPVYALNLTFHYNTSTLSFENDTTESGVYEKVVWAGSYNEIGDVGVPELPAFLHTIKVEDNIVVDSVKLLLSTAVSGTLSYPIMPLQHPIPTGFQREEPIFVKNESVYQENDVFPQNCLIDYHIDQAREGKFLSLTIVPFQYNPTTNVYTTYSVAEVEVFTHEEDNQLRASRTHRDIGIPYYEYVIITSSQFASAFEPFAQWKRAKGYDVGIVNISDILNNPFLAAGDTISNIVDNAGKLRQYLIYSYNAVQTKYVLFGGDFSTIPIRYAYANPKYIPSDFYYSELNCNWDDNHNGIYGEYNDFVDYGAEIYVGRLLCNTTEEVTNWTKKVLQYEINPGNGDYTYLGRALFTQADQMQQANQAGQIQQKLQGNMTCTIYSEIPSYSALNPTAPLGVDIISDINTNHYGLLSNFNHGRPLSYNIASDSVNRYNERVHHAICAMDTYESDGNVMSPIIETGNGFDNLTNNLYPSIMYSTSCDNIPFDDYETPTGTRNLGAVFTGISEGGGPAYLGNTRYGYVEPSKMLYLTFLDTILTNQHLNHLGITEAKSKLGYQSNFLRHSHNLLGCPEMSMYTHIPYTFEDINISTNNNKLIVSTETDSIESRICLSGNINGTYTQFVYTDRSNVTFETIPEIYTLVVSKPNYVPYILTNDTCFLQNQIITNNRIYNGCDSFTIGSDITSLSPYGKVTIESSGNVVINVGNEVIIKNDFDVKLGGQLVIQ